VGGSFKVTVPVTANVGATYDNPRLGGTCKVDPNGNVPESDETNNTCSDSVTVTPPNLQVGKTNNRGGTMALNEGSFTWKFAVRNIAAGAATFADGQVILTDNLPSSGLDYGTITVDNVTNVTGSSNIDCGVSGGSLICEANGGSVTIGGITGGFDVSMSTSPT